MKRTAYTLALLTLTASAVACSSSTANTESTAAAAAPASAPASAPAMAEATGSIVDVAMASGQFNTLITALKAAGLDATLAGEGPFTVFAPTDEAFAKLPAGTVESLLADKEKLTKVLTYHVVSGKVMASDVTSLDSAKTVNGAEVAIDTNDGVKVGGATVVKADVDAGNGVIHVIDTVLIPAE